jgi:hypothetical protein
LVADAVCFLSLLSCWDLALLLTAEAVGFFSATGLDESVGESAGMALACGGSGAVVVA